MEIRITSYYDAILREKHSALSDNECEDLDLNEFFLAVDYTSSCVGRQYLYSLLRCGEVSDVGKHEMLIDRLSSGSTLRAKLIAILSKLKNQDAYNIASLLSEKMPTPSSRKLLLLNVSRFLPFLFVGIALLTHVWSWLLGFAVAFIVNLILHYGSKKHIYQHYFSIPQFLRMLRQMDLLVKEPAFVSVDKEIVHTLDRLQTLRKQLRYFNMSIRLDNDAAILAYLISELLNIFFLTEAYLTNKALILFNGKGKEIRNVFCYWGLLDVLCSVSLLREELPYYCLPSSPASDARLCGTGLYHPLIKNAVANDIVVHDKSVLITGSNMSGKTSFIRTVGISLLSAQVLHTCFARKFAVSIGIRILSAIRVADNLPEGKSYFLREVEQIKDMIDSVSGLPCLFLLDEPFRGTNTKERIAIGKAVLSALAKENNIVFVSTHDLELCRLLDSEYDLYYFSESVKEDKLSFDYQLKKGVSLESNAIKILELYDYPPPIVQMAYDELNRI